MVIKITLRGLKFFASIKNLLLYIWNIQLIQDMLRGFEYA
ncbi:hypothetical protein Bsph_0891 [Lysinibacillus sphaericus C3-41]|uniref:Uncharacterized protein n=1 Tax=Lysinibacillus sphaericus (strain C3-41) TaxID=444177 RepID=B1HZA7_LYSSC|nr:hypothetical protein Bsph_0891 [Lysinibacillus sphaericus C3-41]